MTLCDSVVLTVDRMDSLKKMMLQRHRDKIVRDLDAKHVIDELYSNNVLSIEDTEKIRSQVRLNAFALYIQRNKYVMKQ